jgi:hypothetical protein
MAVAALIVSILSVIFTGGGLIYAHQQADSARKTADLEAARRHEERTPRLHGGIEPMNSGGWYRLWLELDSTEPLSGLVATLPADKGLAFPPSQDGVALGGPSLTATHEGQVQGGSRAAWRIELAEKRARKVRVTVVCKRASEEWRLLVDTDVPYDLLVSVF